MARFCNLSWWQDGPELEVTSPYHVLVLKHSKKGPGFDQASRMEEGRSRRVHCHNTCCRYRVMPPGCLSTFSPDYLQSRWVYWSCQGTLSPLTSTGGGGSLGPGGTHVSDLCCLSSYRRKAVGQKEFEAIKPKSSEKIHRQK